MKSHTGNCTVLVINPQSRNGGEPVAGVIDKLLDLGPVHAFRADDPAIARTAIRDFGGPDTRIVLGGGDGTLTTFLDDVLDTGSTLGILPLGTANDFARSLGIPIDVASAIELICQDHVRTVDVGEVNGKHFLNAIGVGIGPELTREMDAGSKEHLGVLAYPVALMSVLNDIAPFRVRLVVDRARHEIECVQVTIANGTHYGGGLTVSNKSRLNDGLLTVLCILEQPKLRLAAQALALRDGTTDEAEGIRIFSGRDVRLETDEPLEVTADGEFVTQTPIRCNSRARSLKVFAPVEEADTRS